jgi:hypothetical protein
MVQTKRRESYDARLPSRITADIVASAGSHDLQLKSKASRAAAKKKHERRRSLQQM